MPRQRRPMPPAAYLEGIGALGTGNTTITVADAVTRGNGTNNDSALWVTSADIFGPIRKRTDFKTDVEAMLNNVATHLNTLTPLALPATSTNKGVGDPIAETAGSVAKLYLDSGVAGYNRNFFKNWSNNLLYAKLASPVKGERRERLLRRPGVRRRAAAGTEPRPGGAIHRNRHHEQLPRSAPPRDLWHHQRPDRPDRLRGDCAGHRT